MIPSPHFWKVLVSLPKSSCYSYRSSCASDWNSCYSIETQLPEFLCFKLKQLQHPVPEFPSEPVFSPRSRPAVFSHTRMQMFHFEARPWNSPAKWDSCYDVFSDNGNWFIIETHQRKTVAIPSLSLQRSHQSPCCCFELCPDATGSVSLKLTNQKQSHRKVCQSPCCWFELHLATASVLTLISQIPFPNPWCWLE